MKTFLVVNPMSANGQTGKRWPEISARVARGIGEFGHAFTRAPMDAANLASKALHDGYPCVVAVGGDGTLNEVVNGFFENGRVINGSAAVGLIARGTGGDFRRTFGWDLALDRAIERLKGDKTQPFDVGVIDYTTHQGRAGRRYFANIASFGVSGQVDHEVNHSSKALGGKLSFMIGSVKALMKYSDRKVRISVDGGPLEEVTVTTLAVANGRYFGGGMKVCPDADPADGLLDVTVWSGYTLGDFAFRSKSIYDGSHVNWKGTRRLRCKLLRAESAEEVLIDVDGEQPGKLPCQMTVMPSAIRLKI